MKKLCEDCKFDLTRKQKEVVKLAAGGSMRNSFCNYIRKNIKHYRGEQYQKSTMGYLNKNGHCGYYKIKWWKAWLRGIK